MMKRMVIQAFLIGLTSTSLIAANAPIQRVDVFNTLWNSAAGGNGGATLTSVQVSFENGGTTPCFTTTLAFGSSTSVWAGQGQACVEPITLATITPLASPLGIGQIYDTPPTTTINSSFYFTELTINQGTAPTFSSINGDLLTTGTVSVSKVNY
jgi:hypothetical protein